MKMRFWKTFSGKIGTIQKEEKVINTILYDPFLCLYLKIGTDMEMKARTNTLNFFFWKKLYRKLQKK